MNFRYPLMLSAWLLTVAINPLPAAQGNAWGGNQGNQGGNTLTTASVDDAEAATLTFMREEEKLARDLYLAFHDQYQADLFRNIASAEQRHMDAVKTKLDRYGLPDPAQADLLGGFADGELQALYDQLLAQGLASYLDALQVGALVEEVDIEDNRNAIAGTDNPDLQTVYDNLLRGSRNHLRAYAAAIEQLGVVYQAQHLEQADVDAILDSPMERGGAGAGRGAMR
jgi:hypothetical protein